jgi:hypothetical protein
MEIPSHDELVERLKKDPGGRFFYGMVDDLINSVPPERRNELRGMQWRLDKAFDKAHQLSKALIDSSSRT